LIETRTTAIAAAENMTIPFQVTSRARNTTFTVHVAAPATASQA
jgi:hypothetical protein